MNKTQEEVIKTLVEQGVIRLLKEVADEVKKEFKDVEFAENPYQLAFSHGKKEGINEGLNILFDKLEKCSSGT
jgi:hypothetical protein